MSTPKDGGPAFPFAFQELDAQGRPRTEQIVNPGMTLRDYFAGQALAGIVGKAQMARMALSRVEQEVAADAYSYADAMLAGREKGGAK
jgi:hypothetical protein